MNRQNPQKGKHNQFLADMFASDSEQKEYTKSCNKIRLYIRNFEAILINCKFFLAKAITLMVPRES